MKEMNISMEYYYKGSFNCGLHLRQNLEDNTIHIYTDFRERVAVVDNGKDLARIIKDLIAGKYNIK